MQKKLLQRANAGLKLSPQQLLLNDTITGSPRLKTAIANVLNRYVKPATPLKGSHILATNGVASAIEHCSWALCDPGDGVLVGRPYFRGFNRDICLRPGSKLIQVSFDGADPLDVSVASRYEEVIVRSREEGGCAIRAIMPCNPHNPLGRCYSRAFLVELMKICQRYSVHLVSDEIYALSVWRRGRDGEVVMEEFTSVLAIDCDGLIDPALVHVLWRVSKDFGANGMQLGAVISPGNPDLLEAVRGAAQYSSVCGLGDYLTASILNDEEFVDSFVAESNKTLAVNYGYVVAFLDEHGIPYARGSNAGFFIWTDLWVKSRELAEKFALRKVHLGIGEDFGSEQPGWFRITFSQKREWLDEGLKRILDAIGS
ncbi:pyridoxal phosphate-dependent transferase [Aspergillus pseudoustus]|uniref:Pyridoxal phosphate-dependent transferase n=1 Tax=Aspergillus pseudoustus TaxID=1810923 RepID=A0ABR4K8B5_9EURO